MMSWKSSMQRAVYLYSVLILVIATRASAGTWIYPLPNTNSIYNRTDTLNATWATIFSEPYLALLCQADGASTPTVAFNVSVSSAGSRAVDFSQYGQQSSECSLEVADGVPGGSSLNSPNFRITNLESNPPTTWRLSDPSTTSSASATSSTSATSSPSTSPTSSSTVAGSTNPSTTATPTGQSTASSSASAQKSSDSNDLSTGTIVGITLGSVIVLTTILATIWYIRRSHREIDLDAIQLRDLAAVKEAELESSRAVASDRNSVLPPRREIPNYPVGVGGDPSPSPSPSPRRQELGGRPYWGRPF